MGGLAGGRVRSRNSRGIPKKKSCSLNTGLPGSKSNTAAGEMTRRAFLALRVIQRQGKFRSKGLVKNWCK